MRGLRRLRYLLLRKRLDAELREEMAFHRSMTTGPAFGSATLAYEDARAVWIAPFIEGVWQDVSYAMRALRRQPAFSILALSALTAGIGLNVSLFTVYTALAMKPWAVHDPDRVVRVVNDSVTDLRKRAGGAPGGFSQADVEYFAHHTKAFTGFTLLGRPVTVTLGDDGDAVAYWVGGNYFSLLGVEMAAGRGFLPEEDGRGSPAAVALLSYGYWQRQFGADPSIVGRDVRLDGVQFLVVGVASRTFQGTEPDRVDLWLPLASAPLLRPDDSWVRRVASDPGGCCMPVAARLAPNATTMQAQAELMVLNRQIRAARGTGDDASVELRGTEVIADSKTDPRSALIPLSAGLLLVLLLACANVGNVQLARGAARRREIAVRLSLGASRRRLIRQLLTESLVLACIAGAAGVLIAFWLPAEIVRISTGVPTALRLRPDATVLSATVAICVLSCLMAGLAPALQATKRDAIGGLKEGSALPGARFSLRTILLAVQVAAVVVLLASAGVMVRSASRAADRVLGRAAHGISVVSIQPPVRGYDDARMHVVSLALEQAVEPSLSSGSLALTSTPPLASGNIKGAFRLPNAEASSGPEFNAVFEVSPSYFRLMGLKIIDGRGFEPSDAGRSVIVVNETMAKRYWPGRSAVGQRIVCTPPESGWNMPGELEIVGVVQDALMTSFDDVDPAIFQPPTHRGLPQMLTSSPRGADAAAAAVRRLDPALRVRVQPLDDGLAPRLHGARVAAMIAGALGSLALGFACVGMFGVFAYWVRQRTREIGIRMALGAQSSNVIQLVLGTTAGAVGIGLAVGLGAAVLASRLLRSFLFGLSGVDPATYAAVALLLAVSSLAAAFVPARRATRIDPLVALRDE